MRRSLSFRSRILGLVFAVALVPLGLVGWWLSRSAARSGEELLRARLSETLGRMVADVGARWIGQRSALLALAEHPEVIRALDRRDVTAREASPEVRRSFETLNEIVATAELRDTLENLVWVAQQSAQPRDELPGAAATLPLRLGIHRPVSGERIGTLVAHLRASAILAARPAAPFVGGAVVAVLDPATGTSLVSTPFDPENLRLDRFQWAGEEWIVEQRRVTEPRMDLAAAAPLDPFTKPFEAAANRGLWLLLGTATAGLLAAAAITTRMTRGLGRLAAAAEAVAAGDLSRKTGLPGTDEVGRVATTFDTMTDHLERTLAQLSQRESLVAVGQFASELAHEVRNPLTSIRVDLQHVEEQLPADSPLRPIQQGALEEIERLDATVAGVLRLARSGRIELQAIDLLPPLRAAMRAALPEFESRGARLDGDLPLAVVEIQGDAPALQQVFLNLLLNAAQALATGGRAAVSVQNGDHEVAVEFTDNGPGIAPDVLSRIREPFYSTKREGSGLGLAIAERIVQAHGGTLDIESAPGAGTRVTVRLPV
jgi:signal transduction histidine kinase